MLRRIGVLASLAVVAAMFAGTSSASAAAGDAGVCVFTGVSGTLTPSIPGIQADISDIATNPLTVVDIEQGGYNFQGTNVLCAGVFNGTPVTPLDPVTLTSAGDYANILCGTGWASDLDGSGTTLASPGIGTVSNVGYQIPFVAGNGPLVIGAGVSTAPPTLGDPITGDYVGAGAVHITPQNLPGGCSTQAVTQFDVAGGFVAAGLP
jgi:hypothetical protein